MKAPTRILGVGSPFGDDRLGWVAAEAIRESVWCRSRGATVQIERLDRPGPALLDAMEGALHVVLLDGMLSGAPPGTIQRLDFDQIILSADKFLSTHGCGLAETLALGKALARLPPWLTLFAVEMKHPREGTSLSVEVQAALPALVERVQASVEEQRPGAGSAFGGAQTLQEQHRAGLRHCATAATSWM